MLKIWKSKWNQEIAIKTSTVKIWIIYRKSLDCLSERSAPAQLRLVCCDLGQDRCAPALDLLIMQNEGELPYERSGCLSEYGLIQLHYLQKQQAQKGWQKAARDSSGIFHKVLCLAQLVLERVSSRRAAFSSMSRGICTGRRPGWWEWIKCHQMVVKALM